MGCTWIWIFNKAWGESQWDPGDPGYTLTWAHRARSRSVKFNCIRDCQVVVCISASRWKKSFWKKHSENWKQVRVYEVHSSPSVIRKQIFCYRGQVSYFTANHATDYSRPTSSLTHAFTCYTVKLILIFRFWYNGSLVSWTCIYAYLGFNVCFFWKT